MVQCEYNIDSNTWGVICKNTLSVKEFTRIAYYLSTASYVATRSLNIRLSPAHTTIDGWPLAYGVTKGDYVVIEYTKTTD